MVNKPPPFKGLTIRTPIIIPIKGRPFINQRFGLGLTLREPALGLRFCCFGGLDSGWV